MKRTLTAAIGVTLLLSATPVFAQVLDRPVAIVRLTETVNIGQRELRQQVEMLQEQMGRNLTTGQREEVLEAQIGDVLLNQAAARANIRVSDEEIDQAIAAQRQSIGQPVSDSQFRQLIQQQTGLEWDEYVEEIRNRLVQEQFILQEARGRFDDGLEEPTAREIRRVYEENAQQFTNPAMARFDHLFFDLRGADADEEQEARRLATSLARRLNRDTVEYQQVLRESLDDARYSGGDFGYIVRGDQQAVNQLGGEFVNEILDMEEGDISGVLESNVGLHIVRVTDRRAPRLLQLGDPLLPGESTTVRDQIRAYILNQQQQQIFQESVQSVLARLQDEAEITRFPENLNW
ncbi:MAG TPA: peptidyl-prolyl cis-trans isomerase [Alkalispirochaeta sp.]|nr:peptidyl-prolyl cis-trans isomerase [Alkalispirochaeta sp.]